MKPRVHRRRRRVLLLVIMAGSAIVLARAFRIQIIQHEHWRERAESQHRQRLELAAARGTIYDRNGVPLTSNREVFRIAVAPREIRDRPRVVDLLKRVLELPERAVRSAVNPSDPWSVLPGHYDAGQKQRLAGTAGIHFERVVERYYPHGDLARSLIGRVGAGGRALGGIELEFDSVLSGRAGVAVVRRDARGNPIPGAMVTVVAPEPGHDIRLSIDHNLQAIAEATLERAIAETGAAGGDVLLADPWTGEILAAASRRDGRGRYWWAVMEPYEPGSTLKPFTVAALLVESEASLDDIVYAEQGRYVHNGRVIEDSHAYGWLTLADALRLSSNIAMAKMAQRLARGEQYRVLRDFGFGTATGVAYPSESGGLLRPPEAWSEYSRASLSFGYEIMVTPLQLTMAYGALANGGVLMDPRIVLAVTARDGRVLRRTEPRPIRRVIPERIARSVGRVLVSAVEDGTGTRAALDGFKVAGKTGTAKRAGEAGYAGGGYTASFAGYFPANAPRLVFLIKLDRPRGPYYGGLAAAPAVRDLLRAALAARGTPINRRKVVAAVRSGSGTGPRVIRVAGSGAASATESARAKARAPARSGRFVFSLTSREAHGTAVAVPSKPLRAVPDVAGLWLRDAIRRLHGRGFHVRVVGGGRVESTRPRSGERARVGAVVLVEGTDPAAAIAAAREGS